MISPAERTNFLRQCWRNRQWKDGMGTLLLPLRLSLYQMRRNVQRIAKSGSGVATAPPATAQRRMPVFLAEINPIFTDRYSCDVVPEHVKLVFAEVDDQLRGMFRLAGGRQQNMTIGSSTHFADIEDAHAYARLYWARRYAEAAAFGHKRAETALLAELSAWFETGCKDSAVALWPYTVAERIASLTSVLFWINAGNVSGLLPLIPQAKQQIWRDACRLSETVEYGLGVHNHLLNDARGLFLASAALADCEQAEGWRAQAMAIWDEYFPKLVLEDGTFTEQSSHYHLLLCRTALEYWLAAQRTGHALPALFEARICKMFVLANQLLRADGTLARFGDNTPDCVISDLWGLVAAAYHYGLLKESPQHRAIAPLTLFYCGEVPQLPPSPTPERLSLFPQGGFACLRSEISGAELTAHGDCRAGIAPHGDAGRGSYELWWGGRALILEPGSFFSSSDAGWQAYSRAEAQNVTSLNGLAPMITKQDNAYLARWYGANGGAWKRTSSNGVEFRCETFRRLHADIILIRSWQFDAAGNLSFSEQIEGSTQVQFESRICLGDAPWEMSGDHASASTVWRCCADNGASADMLIETPKQISAFVRPCTFIPEYGVTKQGRVVLLTGSQQLPMSWSIHWNFRMAA